MVLRDGVNFNRVDYDKFSCPRSLLKYSEPLHSHATTKKTTASEKAILLMALTMNIG